MQDIKILTQNSSLTDSYVSEAAVARPSSETLLNKQVTDFVKDSLEQLLPKKETVKTIPIVSKSLEHTDVMDDISSFEKLVEAISLKIWTLLRAHVKQVDQYQEEMEHVYRDAIKAQVRTYLSWTKTAFHVASIALGVTSIAFTVLPEHLSKVCMKTLHNRNLFPFEWYHQLITKATIDPMKFAENVIKVLDISQKVNDAGSRIQGNYSEADRLTSQGTGELAKTRMEKLSRNSEEAKTERSTVLQTLQQMYQQEAEARKAISR